MATRERPLSPHLQIYKKQVQMMTSITHRITGVILAVGALALVCGLMALAGGQESWDRFVACLASPVGMLLMLGFSWALAYHLLNGIRHLIQDVGYGFAIPDFVRSSWISVIGSVLLTALAWGVVLMRWGQV